MYVQMKDDQWKDAHTTYSNLIDFNITPERSIGYTRNHVPCSIVITTIIVLKEDTGLYRINYIDH